MRLRNALYRYRFAHDAGWLYFSIARSILWIFKFPLEILLKGIFFAAVALTSARPSGAVDVVTTAAGIALSCRFLSVQHRLGGPTPEFPGWGSLGVPKANAFITIWKQTKNLTSPKFLQLLTAASWHRLTWGELWTSDGLDVIWLGVVRLHGTRCRRQI